MTLTPKQIQEIIDGCEAPYIVRTGSGVCDATTISHPALDALDPATVRELGRLALERVQEKGEAEKLERDAADAIDYMMMMLGRPPGKSHAPMVKEAFERGRRAGLEEAARLLEDAAEGQAFLGCEQNVHASNILHYKAKTIRALMEKPDAE